MASKDAFLCIPLGKYGNMRNNLMYILGKESKDLFHNLHEVLATNLVQNAHLNTLILVHSTDLGQIVKTSDMTMITCQFLKRKRL